MEYTVFAQRLDLKKSHSLAIAKDSGATDHVILLKRHVGLSWNVVSLTSDQETEITDLSDTFAIQIHDLLFGGTDGS